MQSLGQSTSDQEGSKGKGPVGMDLVCSKTRKKAVVAGFGE